MEEKIFRRILSQYFTKNAALAALSNLRDEATKAIFGKDRKADFDGLNKDNVYVIFDRVHDKIENADTLVVTLAIELPNDSWKLIGEKLRTDYGPNFLVEQKIDRSLIAGATIAWRGQLRDYSWKTKLANCGDTILELVRKMGTE